MGRPVAWRGRKATWIVLAVVLAAAVVLLPPFALALVAVGAATFLLALTVPEWAVAAIVASVPLQRTVEAGDGLTATKVIVWAAIAGWLIYQWWRGEPVPIDAIGVAWLVYVVVLMTTIVPARDVSAWAGEVYRWAVALLVYVMARSVFMAGRSVIPALAAMGIGTLGISLLGMWQVLTHAGPPSFTTGGMTRAFGTFGEPNPFAGYLEMTLPMLLALVAHWATLGGETGRLSWSRIGFVTLTWLAGSMTLVLTQSRGGIAGIAVGTVVVLWLTGRRARRVGTVGAVIVAGVILLSPAGGRVISRFAGESLSAGAEAQVTVGNFASLERAAHWRAAIAMARSEPLLGVGAGNFNARFREMTEVWRFRIPRGHAHNAYLQALAQAGVLGLLAYLALLGVVVRTVWRRLRHHESGIDRAIIAGAAGVTGAVAVHNLVEYLHVLSLGLQLAVIWALAGSSSRTAGHDEQAWMPRGAHR